MDSPVAWEVIRSVPAGGTSLLLTATGELVRDTISPVAAGVTPPTAWCPGSLRVAASPTRLYAVWWSPRADSTSVLQSSSSGDSGRTWGRVVPVDTADHGASGCDRSAPAISADEASGYVHVTYAMQAAEGPGLFYAHSMDRGATFHSPVPILYGERLGSTSVAASGDVVAVAFEDPGSRTPRIGLALSATMGHIFESRVMPVSDDNSAATQPLVAVRGRRLAVAWHERPASNGGMVMRLRTGSIP